MVQACSFRNVAAKPPFTPVSQVGRQSTSRGHCTSSKRCQVSRVALFLGLTALYGMLEKLIAVEKKVKASPTPIPGLCSLIPFSDNTTPSSGPPLRRSVSPGLPRSGMHHAIAAVALMRGNLATDTLLVSLSFGRINTLFTSLYWFFKIWSLPTANSSHPRAGSEAACLHQL